MQDYLIYNTLTDFVLPDAFHKDYHIHLLCKSGKMSFFCGGKAFKATAGDFLIWQMTTEFADISYSDDFDATLLMISNPFLRRHNPEMIWATKGYMYIKEHPVFRLDRDELEIIETDFRQFYQRIRTPGSLFGEEIVGSLLAILLYDMWNIYSREIEKAEIEDITSRRFLRFLMSVQENCREQREVAWYARELGLAPKYLSGISKSITGRPAGDWIDSYAAHELQKLLSDQRLTLTDIVDAMHFSSQPALTRYMKRVMHTTPSEFRQKTK
ncbi:MAG: AraC family transcriptional regulator [Bacteroidales bacterium]|nr:AraC family transcriptional regulator [Bacteroidales bacterium]